MESVRGYRVVRKLATGGTSDVLLAKAEGPHGFERTVVLKVLLAQYRHDDELSRMFAREAAAYARLSHPAIVKLFDFFSVAAGSAEIPSLDAAEEGQLCMVLEHVDGPPLSRLRSMLKAVGRELDDGAAVYVGARIFDALAAAHAAVDESGMIAPVIHRDVNPSNVLVPWDGQVKLADFGVAKVTGANHQSAAGVIKGTYGYMAPEQVTGDAITPRADVYAGAIVLWELLARRRAFHRGAVPEAEALRVMAKPRLTSLDLIRPDVDRAVREALARALEPRAERRTITAEEMVSILHDSVSAEDGRERLVLALDAVRYDPQAAMAAASIPPTPAASLMPRPTGSLVPRPAAGKLPKPGPPPLPPILQMKPEEPEDRVLAGAHGAVTVPAGSSPSADGERPSDQTITIGHQSEGTIAAVKLGNAIDEVLRSQPSSLPPIQLSELNVEVTPARLLSPVLPPDLPKLGDRNVEETSTLKYERSGDTPMGVIPVAPPPLGPATPQGFAAAVREVESAQALTVSPPEPSPPAIATTPSVGPPPLPSVGPPPLPAASPVTVPSVGPPPLPDAPFPLGADVEPPAARSSGRTIAVVGILAIGLLAGTTSVFSYVVGYRRPPPIDSVSRPSSTQAARASVSASASAPASSSAAPAASQAPVSSSSAFADADVVAAPSASAVPSASAPPSTSAAPSADVPEVPEGTGILRTTGAIAGRRIFVDERTLGQTPESVTVKCGPHVVRLGSAGKPQNVDVPCGSEILVSDRPAN